MKGSLKMAEKEPGKIVGSSNVLDHCGAIINRGVASSLLTIK